MKYEIKLGLQVQKQLNKLDKKHSRRVFAAMVGLEHNPFPAASTKLIGKPHTYRLRVGDYRVIYEVDGRILKVYIIRIDHRKDVYKK